MTKLYQVFKSTMKQFLYSQDQVKKQGLEFRLQRKKFHHLGFNSSQSGFTIVELFIAIALGIVMSLGLIQLFVTTRQTYTLNNGLSLMMENANAAMSSLSRTVGFAGHQGYVGVAAAQQLSMGCWSDAPPPNSNFATNLGTNMTFNQCMQAATCPCVVNAPGTTAPATNSNPNCPVCSYQSYMIGGTTYYQGVVSTMFALQNYDGSTTGTCWVGDNGNPLRTATTQTCTKATNVDYIYAVGGAWNQSYNMEDPNHMGYGSNPITMFPAFTGAVGSYDIVLNPTSSDYLLVTYTGGNNITDCQGIAVPANIMVANLYLVQADANGNPYLACITNKMDIVQNTAWSVQSAPVKIASGVEAFRVVFAQDTDFDGAPNIYVNGSAFNYSNAFPIYLPMPTPSPLPSTTAAGMANATTFQLMGVKVALLMRTDNPSSNVLDNRTYNLLGYTPGPNGTQGPYNDYRVRKVFTATMMSNECLPAIRPDCRGAPIWGGANSGWSSGGPYNGSISGYLTISNTLWFTQQPVGSNYYGCSMDASGNMSVVTTTTLPPPTNPTPGPNPLPYLKDDWDSATSADGKFNCFFR